MTSTMEQGALATVFGGSGFVGRHTVRALAKDGWRIRAAVRRPDLAGHLQPMGRVGQIHAVQANVRYPESVMRAADGARVIVSLVGVLAPAGKQSFEAVHVDGARAIAKAAKTAGAEQLVHVSAIGADPNSPGRYGRTKAEGEAAVLAEFPNAVILRPSIIFGPEDEFFNRFAAMAAHGPLLPLIGGGRTRFQPVYVGDVAAAIAAAVEGRARPGTVYELGGPEVLTFRKILERVQEYAGRHRGYMPMPFWLASLIGTATSILPSGMRPFTVDQMRMLKSDNVVSEPAEKEGRTLAGLGITAPHAISTIVPAYLEQYQPKGQYAHYRG
ncbi:MAG: complex I NDUFA9 subunit family protein [Hyphomicrobiaceae bacterium]|nr:complex I NDUFA9 subunit family protein [Hyphomicrobiaceae bacterium]